MIKEFWQERKEEKKRQKQLKKEYRKLPKTKEQIAYKVFGFLFAIFLIFGSIGYACNNTGSLGDYSWENVVGITDEMIEELEKPVDKNLILNECVLSSLDWTTAQEELITQGISIVSDGRLDAELMLSEGNYINSSVTFSMMSLGAIVYQMIEEMGNGDKIELHSFKLYEDGDGLILKSVITLNLSDVVANTTLPMVYVTTTSRLEVLNKSLSSLYATTIINNLETDINEEIVELINDNSYLELSYYTNTQIVSQINTLASILNANIEINGTNINFVPKN